MRWLLDDGGRPYHAPRNATAYSILYQPIEGALWRRLTSLDGTPRTVPLDVTRTDLEAAVGRATGSYSLVPVSQGGDQAGDPPQMIFIPPRVVERG